MRWALSWRADPRARALADRHYNRQTPGAAQFVPPGRDLVLLAEDQRALWVTSWPFQEYVQHAWAGAWVCSIFRNEGTDRSSDLIREACAATRFRFGAPPEPHGMVTFVDAGQVRHKRDPGRCFLRAGFQRAGRTRGGLYALTLAPADFPSPEAARGTQLALAGGLGR